jgi:hypothetical protein
LSGNTYTTNAITANCSVSASFAVPDEKPVSLPGVLMLLLDDD